MHDNENSNAGHETTGNESSPLEAVIQQHHHQQSEAKPTEKDPYDEFQDRMMRVGRRLARLWKHHIKKGWKRTKFHDRISVIVAISGLVVLIVYTIFTIKMWSANKQAADAAKIAAQAAEEATTIAQKQLIANERPWLAAEFILTGPVVTSDPNGAVVNYTLRVKNVGHSPAFNIQLMAAVFNRQAADFIPDQNKLCLSWIPITAEGGAVVFPGAEWIQRIGVAAPAAEMERSKTFIGYRQDELLLHAAGCIDYTDQLSGEHHQTFYSYMIGAVSDTGNFAPIIRGSTIPMNRIRFYSDSPVGNGAN